MCTKVEEFLCDIIRKHIGSIEHKEISYKTLRKFKKSDKHKEIYWLKLPLYQAFDQSRATEIKLTLKIQMRPNTDVWQKFETKHFPESLLEKKI